MIHRNYTDPLDRVVYWTWDFVLISCAHWSLVVKHVLLSACNKYKHLPYTTQTICLGMTCDRRNLAYLSPSHSRGLNWTYFKGHVIEQSYVYKDHDSWACWFWSRDHYLPMSWSPKAQSVSCMIIFLLLNIDIITLYIWCSVAGRSKVL